MAIGLQPWHVVNAFEWSGYVGIEDLGFIHKPTDTRQHRNYVSGVIEPELYHEWDNGQQSLAFVPFFRWSQHDNHRTHFDIRELTWLKVAESWELRVGFRKVFWGVAESQHLIDIINQTDLVENFDTEDKLGQPMVNLAVIGDWGTLDLFFLTGFRERTFPGAEGRPRFFLPAATSDARFEKNGVEKHLGFAARWSKPIGDWDLGFAHFYGMNRDPSFIPEFDSQQQPRLVPYYEMIHQTSVDVQATKGSWLWKLESMVRSGQGKTYFAGTSGLEYTFFNIQDSSIDLGIVAEYLYDGRGSHALTIFQDDFMLGLRFALNDIQSTELLAGVVFDRTTSAKFYNIEASRRIGDHWKVEMEARFFSGASQQDLAYMFRDDDHFRLEVTYHY
ncbi:MAG: hypothetical protein V3U75_11955 [Methylococcaceae bacterium]